MISRARRNFLPIRRFDLRVYSFWRVAFRGVFRFAVFTRQKFFVRDRFRNVLLFVLFAVELFLEVFFAAVCFV